MLMLPRTYHLKRQNMPQCTIRDDMHLFYGHLVITMLTVVGIGDAICAMNRLAQ